MKGPRPLTRIEKLVQHITDTTRHLEMQCRFIRQEATEIGKIAKANDARTGRLDPSLRPRKSKPKSGKRKPKNKKR